MSEYWVSHKKYFCKYCDIYISDDAPSRRQHETGMRHKGNTERFVRNLYKQGERRKKDLEEEKREMVRVEQAANAAFTRDVSAGRASAASSSRLSQPAPSASSSKKPEKPASVWFNYSSAQSLGIVDLDEERMKDEMERRRTQGLVGEWETVAPPPPPLPEEKQAAKEEDSKNSVQCNAVPRKREAEVPAEDESDIRQFKLRKRTLGAGLDEIWDPGDITVKPRLKKEEEEQGASLVMGGGDSKRGRGFPSVGSREAGQTPQGLTGEMPKWKSMGWKPAIGIEPNAPTETNKFADEQEIGRQNEVPSIKSELVQISLKSDLDHPDNVSADRDITRPVKREVKEEEALAPIAPEQSGGLFKKRKVPIGGRGRR